MILDILVFPSRLNHSWRETHNPIMSSWFSRARFRRSAKKLVRSNTTPYHKVYRDLVRADRDKVKEAALSRRRGMDAVPLPFVTPKGHQDDVVYIIYETFYCEIPVSDERGSSPKGDGNAVRTYSEWLNNNRRVHGAGVSKELLSALRSSKAAVQHPDTLAALNHFLLENKFVLEGHLLWIADDTTVTDTEGAVNLLPDKTRDFLTLVYHRTVPPDSSGITMDSNIFTLMSAQGDTTSAMQITETPSQEIVSLLNEAIKGTDTNIVRPLPTDKSLYAMVTVILSHDFNHIGGNKQEIQ